jgi:tetratricopeptide (TPR) repeat protein
MVPKAFLSLSAEDAAFVDRVYRHLPHGQAFFFKQSFANGALMLEVMEREVATSQLFVLFASKASLEKTWVKFEIEQARLARINGSQKRLQVFPADGAVTPADLPEWMRQFWFDQKARGARDIARLISRTLNIAVGTPLAERMYGRGVLQDDLRRRFNAKRRELGGSTNPNVILGSGVEQIGRETLIKNTLPLLFPAIPNIAGGPIIDLPTWAGIKDVYRAVREIVEDNFNLSAYETDLASFDALDEKGQVEELTLSLSHFEELGEAVIIRAPSFIYDQGGKLQSWVRAWFESLAKKPALVIGIVTNRQIPAEDEVFSTNVCQMPVVSLADDDVKLIIDDLAAELKLQSQNPSRDLLVQIGGHPVLARAFVRLAEQYGAGIFERSPTKLFAIQDGILHDNIDSSRINDLQRAVLHVLSWLPKLDAFVLERICLEKEEERPKYNDSLNDLILGCLVEAKGASLSISGAVRAIFRRKFGYGSDALLGRLATVLEVQLAEADAAGAVRADLIDAIIFMYVLTGKAMPNQFRRLILPSTLETLVRDNYNSGRENESSYDLVIKWGLIAEDMKMDEAVREEILSSVLRAYVRKEEFPEADELLKKFDQRNYRSRFFLRGFKLMKEGESALAIPHLVNALKENRYRGSAVNQLGIAYFQTGNVSKLDELLKANGRFVEKSAFLLDLRAQFYTAENNYPAAERDIQALARLPEDNGRSRKRRAIILAKRDRNFSGAVQVMGDLIDGVKGRAIPFHFLRGILAAKGGDRATAMAEAEFVRTHARRSGTKQYHKIMSRLALSERNWKVAIESLDHLVPEGVPDRFLRADALRIKSEDATVGIADRERAKSEMLRIVGRATTHTDLDFSDEE